MLGGDIAWECPILPDAATTFLHNCKQSDGEGDEDDYLLDTIALYVGKLRLSFFFDGAAPRNIDRDKLPYVYHSDPPVRCVHCQAEHAWTLQRNSDQFLVEVVICLTARKVFQLTI